MFNKLYVLAALAACTQQGVLQPFPAAAQSSAQPFAAATTLSSVAWYTCTNTAWFGSSAAVTVSTASPWAYTQKITFATTSSSTGNACYQYMLHDFTVNNIDQYAGLISWHVVPWTWASSTSCTFSAVTESTGSLFSNSATYPLWPDTIVSLKADHSSLYLFCAATLLAYDVATITPYTHTSTASTFADLPTFYTTFSDVWYLYSNNAVMTAASGFALAAVAGLLF
jgi:hypothetical protein